MRFIAEILHDDEPGDHLIEFGFEDVGAVYADDDVMYVQGLPVVLSSVQVVEGIAIEYRHAEDLARNEDFSNFTLE